MRIAIIIIILDSIRCGDFYSRSFPKHGNFAAFAKVNQLGA